jgi:hypothetical protein
MLHGCLVGTFPLFDAIVALPESRGASGTMYVVIPKSKPSKLSAQILGQ